MPRVKTVLSRSPAHTVTCSDIVSKFGSPQKWDAGFLIYQHATRDRDRAIAKALGTFVREARKPAGRRPTDHDNQEEVTFHVPSADQFSGSGTVSVVVSAACAVTGVCLLSGLL